MSGSLSVGKAVSENPVIKTIGVILTISALFGSLGTGWFYLEGLRADVGSLERSILNTSEVEKARDEVWLKEDDEEWLQMRNLFTQVLQGQEQVRNELAQQTLHLQDLKTALGDSYDHRTEGFMQVEAAHNTLLNTLTTSQDDLNYRLGLHTGNHDNLFLVIEGLKNVCASRPTGTISQSTDE